ncbi:MAG TPA: hypothetical protein DGN59_01115 [Candidatus Latescibacteria bacterium]|nr:hypothetical protein [Candidatus Latescibacterota bacterium]
MRHDGPAEESSLDLGHYDGHYTPGNANLIRMGYIGIRNRAKEKLIGESDPSKRDFLEATVISYDAACAFAEKHARHAEALADETTDPQRRVELMQMAEVCYQIASGPPDSFHAGLQMMWFTFMYGARGSIGRFDQWMYPLYKRDVESGKLTHDQAQELLENYFVKLNYYAGNNDSLRNIALAGQTPEGEDACNDVTYMCLEAGGKLMLPEPKLNVRFFDDSPPELLRASCRLTCKGLSNPAYFNDDVAIPGLLELGIPIEDARDYCNDGCSELIIGGKSTIRFRNFDSLPSLCETVQRGEEESFGSFPEVMSDFQARLEDHIPNEHGQKRAVTFPYFAASLDDCLEEASVTGVRYSIWGSIPSQIGNVADGLAAIQRFIFDEESLTWEELNQALRDDFEGHEPLRQRILNRAPKYGNDDDEVDRILKQVSEKFCDAVHDRAQNPVGPGGKTAPGFMTFGIHRRRLLPASPDGRKYEDNVASSFSPALGRDRNSPTAVLKSVSKVDLRKAGHGSVLDMAFHPSALKGEEGLEKFMSFVDTFLKLPCTTTLQANVIDRETLLAARENPTDPQYRTLLVRVWGFSTVFVSLDPDLQQHVIERTEHEL